MESTCKPAAIVTSVTQCLYVFSFLIKDHTTKTYRGVEFKLRALYISALDRGDRSASHSDPPTYWIGRWMGPRASLDVVAERKILSLAGK
jgi:hypothetical protein